MTDRPGIDTVYQENRALRGEMDRLRAELAEKTNKIECLKAFIADRIHDASIERMMMEVGR